jgi:hypothetical protein
MAERFLEVEVSRKQFSVVFLRVDDADPEWSQAFAGDGLGAAVWRLAGRVAFEAVGETCQDYDWEVPLGGAEVDVEGIEIISGKAARAYKFFDVVGGPCRDERELTREELEAAGQMRLEVTP